MKSVLAVLLVCCCVCGMAQRYEYVYLNPTDSAANCYLKFYPKTETIKGLIIRDYSKLFDANQPAPYQFTQLATEAGFMVVITNTSNQFPELFTSDTVMARLDLMVQQVVARHQIPVQNIFIGGISSSGTRALRYAQYCAQGKSSIKIRGVFAVDAPLDLERFYYSALHHKPNFTHGMLWEANLILPLFDALFGGGPKAHLEAYQKASVFSHTDSLGGNASLLKHTDMIIFHEPDIDWWIRERGCGYYDINSFDLAAFAVLMNKLGHQNFELVTTTGKGFDRQGNRNPHSWTIVDEKYLIEWLLKRVN